jgi:hypothetical protein
MESGNKNQVIVTDIQMPFMSMVTFMVKWSLAAIPAILILTFFGFAVFTVLTAIITSRHSQLEVKTPTVETPAAKPKEPEPLSITLHKKGYRERDLNAGFDKDVISFGVSFTNLTEKDMRAFDGVLTFTDLLDNKIESFPLAINMSLNAGANLDWDGQIEHNKYINSRERLHRQEIGNLKIIFTARKVLFADGSTKEYD